MVLRPDDFEYVRTLVRDHSAIIVESEKTYLVEARLEPLARQEGFDTIRDLVIALRGRPVAALHRRVVEAMTTNETSWFRDKTPFDMLRKQLIPEFMGRRARERTLNVWCAAASSGQEPYSVLMTMHHYFPELASWTVRCLGSDLSEAMVQRMRQGSYSQLEVNRGLPAPMLVRYFEKKGLAWEIVPELRARLDVRQINLLDPWASLPQFDIVFLRNVLIYFDVPTKREILARVGKLLRPDGYLFLGGAETTINLHDAFERVDDAKTGCYRIRASVVAA